MKKNKAGNTWTEARWNSFIRSALRIAFIKYPVRYQVLNDSKREYKGKDKRRKWEYQCAECKDWFKSTEIQVDHIKPCGTFKKGYMEQFIINLFCEQEDLQVLCKPCHKIKTQKEKAPK